MYVVFLCQSRINITNSSLRGIDKQAYSTNLHFISCFLTVVSDEHLKFTEAKGPPAAWKTHSDVSSLYSAERKVEREITWDVGDDRTPVCGEEKRR